MLNIKDDNFGREVRKQLIDLNYTTKQLADELKISRTYLYEILNGYKKGFSKRKEIVNILEQWKLKS